MTTPLATRDIVSQMSEHFPGAVTEVTDTAIVIDGQHLREVMAYFKTTPGLEFDYLTTVTGIDCGEYFEVAYQLVSLAHNHSLLVKARAYGRENPALPSVVSLWRSADLQEREIYDLLGVTFEGHPNLKRIVLWDGFQGHPLRKDYL